MKKSLEQCHHLHGLGLGWILQWKLDHAEWKKTVLMHQAAESEEEQRFLWLGHLCIQGPRTPGTHWCPTQRPKVYKHLADSWASTRSKFRKERDQFSYVLKTQPVRERSGSTSYEHRGTQGHKNMAFYLLNACLSVGHGARLSTDTVLWNPCDISETVIISLISPLRISVVTCPVKCSEPSVWWQSREVQRVEGTHLSRQEGLSEHAAHQQDTHSPACSHQ